jgi:hypothetical protein
MTYCLHFLSFHTHSGFERRKKEFLFGEFPDVPSARRLPPRQGGGLNPKCAGMDPTEEEFVRFPVPTGFFWRLSAFSITHSAFLSGAGCRLFFWRDFHVTFSGG